MRQLVFVFFAVLGSVLITAAEEHNITQLPCPFANSSFTTLADPPPVVFWLEANNRSRYVLSDCNPNYGETGDIPALPMPFILMLDGNNIHLVITNATVSSVYCTGAGGVSSNISIHITFSRLVNDDDDTVLPHLRRFGGSAVTFVATLIRSVAVVIEDSTVYLNRHAANVSSVATLSRIEVAKRPYQAAEMLSVVCMYGAAAANQGLLSEAVVSLQRVTATVRGHFAPQSGPFVQHAAGGELGDTFLETGIVALRRAIERTNVTVNNCVFTFLWANVAKSDFLTSTSVKSGSNPEMTARVLWCERIETSVLVVTNTRVVFEASTLAYVVDVRGEINAFCKSVTIIAENVSMQANVSGPRDVMVLSSGQQKLDRQAGLIGVLYGENMIVVVVNCTMNVTIVPVRPPAGDYDPTITEVTMCVVLDLSTLASSLSGARALLRRARSSFAIDDNDADYGVWMSNVAARCTVPAESYPPFGAQGVMNFGVVSGGVVSDVSFYLSHTRYTLLQHALLCRSRQREVFLGPAGAGLTTFSVAVVLSVGLVCLSYSERLIVVIERDSKVIFYMVPQRCIPGSTPASLSLPPKLPLPIPTTTMSKLTVSVALIVANEYSESSLMSTSILDATVLKLLAEVASDVVTNDGPNSVPVIYPRCLGSVVIKSSALIVVQNADFAEHRLLVAEDFGAVLPTAALGASSAAATIRQVDNVGGARQDNFTGIVALSGVSLLDTTIVVRACQVANSVPRQDPHAMESDNVVLIEVPHVLLINCTLNRNVSVDIQLQSRAPAFRAFHVSEDVDVLSLEDDDGVGREGTTFSVSTAGVVLLVACLDSVNTTTLPTEKHPVRISIQGADGILADPGSLDFDPVEGRRYIVGRGLLVLSDSNITCHITVAFVSMATTAAVQHSAAEAGVDVVPRSAIDRHLVAFPGTVVHLLGSSRWAAPHRSSIFVRCVTIDSVYASLRRLTAPKYVVPRDDIDFSPECPPMMTVTRVAEERRVRQPIVRLVPTYLAAAITAGYMASPSLGTGGLQMAYRSLRLATRCGQQGGRSSTWDAEDADDAGDLFMSDVMDNPSGLAASSDDVPAELRYAVGSVAGNIMLMLAHTLLVIAAFVIKLLLPRLLTVAQIERHEACGTTRSTTSWSLSFSRCASLQWLRVVRRGAMDAGGYVASYGTSFGALSQPLLCAGVGILAALSSHDAATTTITSTRGFVVLTVSALIAVTLAMFPVALWCWQILWKWRGSDFPFTQQRRVSRSSKATEPSQGLAPSNSDSSFYTYVREALRRFRHKFDPWLLRLLPDMYYESVWRRRAPGASSKNAKHIIGEHDAAYLEVIETYRLQRRWFLAVDWACALVLPGTISGVAWTLDTGSSCQWALWMLSGISAVHAFCVACLQPYIRRWDNIFGFGMSVCCCVVVGLSSVGSEDSARYVAIIQGFLFLAMMTITALSGCWKCIVWFQHLVSQQEVVSASNIFEGPRSPTGSLHAAWMKRRRNKSNHLRLQNNVAAISIGSSPQEEHHGVLDQAGALKAVIETICSRTRLCSLRAPEP